MMESPQVEEKVCEKHLPLFNIGNMTGFDQEKFTDPWMKIGGCGAVTACDISIYLTKYKNMCLYPFDTECVSKRDYIAFSKIMKPFLSPRFTGIDTLEAYIEGFRDYVLSRGENITLTPLYANCDFPTFKEAVITSVDKEIPVPMLVLRHKKPSLSDFVWHWFYIAGYIESERTTKVEVISYGKRHFFDLAEIYDSGYERKGGVVIINI